MTALDLDEWICPHCGQTNAYHSTRCHRCAHIRKSPGGAAVTNRPRIPKNELFPRSRDRGTAGLQKKIIFPSLTTLALIAWLVLIWEYHKWDAQWGSINVLLPTLLVAVFLGWWISRRNWFRNWDNPTRWRFIIVPVVGFILCAWAGIYFTEPIEVGGSVTRHGNFVDNGHSTPTADRRSPDYRYDYSRTRASRSYFWSSILDFGEGVGGAADGAGDLDEGCLFFLLVILVIMLIFGSLTIPHFWVLATFMILVIMAMVTYREWRLEKSHP